MKQSCLFFLIFLLCFKDSFPQQGSIDSLKDLIASANSSRRVELYADIAGRLRNTNADSAMLYAQSAFDLAQELGNDRLNAIAHISVGRIVTVKGHYTLANKYYSQALELATRKNLDSLRAHALIGIGVCYWQLGRHAEALENHFEALRIREKMNDQTGIISSKVHIGMVYQSQEKLPLAEKYVTEALAVPLINSDPSLLLNTMHTLANIYGMQGKIKEAFAIDEKGIEIAIRTNNVFGKALFYDNMGNCYFYGTPPDYEKAFEFFTKALHIDSAFSNKKQMSDSYLNLGNVLLEQGKYEQSFGYFNHSIHLANESGYNQGKLKAMRLLAESYKRSGRSELAFAALQQSIAVKDSLVNNASEARIAEMEALYETEKKQQQINLQQEQLSKKNYIIGGTVLLAFLAGLLGISVYRRYRLRQQARLQQEIILQQELATRAVIEAEENERQRIARDLHDGVGQMMSAAKMNLSAFESENRFESSEKNASLEKIIGLVDDSCREIRSVSHNMMPNALLKNSLATAIRDFIEKMDKKTLQIHLYTEGLDEKLDPGTETVFYRVIQECVNNVIKHAEASTLDISVVKDSQGIHATIEDNGRGFDITKRETFEGIGLRNIMTRVEYLKGTVEFDSSPGKGTVVALFVPLAVNPANIAVN